ncbi:Protein of unknown function [Cotesia congregata]|uniref:Uncharacterized protein n=1 Tax=Cotesia congregata TaxID=51543 RepID=A0A8J2MQ09_COTCN|nr:Protein of unknown function [Cotesia congregata]
MFFDLLSFLFPIGSGPCYQSIGPGSNPAYTNEYFQYLSVYYSAQPKKYKQVPISKVYLLP